MRDIRVGVAFDVLNVESGVLCTRVEAHFPYLCIRTHCRVSSHRQGRV